MDPQPERRSTPTFSQALLERATEALLELYFTKDAGSKALLETGFTESSSEVKAVRKVEAEIPYIPADLYEDLTSFVRTALAGQVSTLR